MSEEEIGMPEDVIDQYLPQVTFEGPMPEDFDKLRPRQQAILLLTALGRTTGEIARMLKIENRSVSGELYRADPDHKFRLSPAQVKQIQKAYWLRNQMLAFGEITPEDIQEAKAMDKFKMAALAQDRLDKIEQPAERRVSASDLLKRLQEARNVTEESKQLKQENQQ